MADLKYIDEDVYEEIRMYTIEKDDLYLTIAGTIGKVGEIPDALHGMNLTENAARLTEIVCDKRYLMYSLMTDLAQNHFSLRFHQVAQPKLSIETSSSTLIAMPPLAEQKRIVRAIENIFNCFRLLDLNLAALEGDVINAKKLILDLAIYGKLVPQDPADEPASELLRRINPAFKPSDNLHYIDSIPTGWVCCPLYAVCEILDSQRKPINSKEREKRVEKATTLFPYYGATGQVGVIDDYIFDGVYLLLGEDGAPFLDRYAKKAYSVSGKIWVNNHAHILKPRINALYMMCYLNAINYRPYVTGTTRLKLTQEAMRSIPVLVPPLPEQERITSRIKLLFHVIDAIQLS